MTDTTVPLERRSTSPTTTPSSSACPTSGSARCAARTPSTSTPSRTAPASTPSPATPTSARCTATVDVYSSEIGGTSLEDLDPDQIEARKSMIDMDPPRHNELRGLIARRFTPRAVQVWEEAVRTVSDRRARPRRCRAGRVRLRRGDLLRDPDAGLRRDPRRAAGGPPLHRRARRPAARQPGPRVRATRPTTRHRLLPFSSPAALEMFEFGRKLADARRKHPRDDIVTQLAVRRRSPSASSTSTSCCSPPPATRRRGTRSRHGLLGAARAPRPARAPARATRSCYKPAADEMLRWATPVHHFRRTTTRGHRAGGHRDPGRRQGHDLVRLGQPRRGRSSRTRTRFDVGRDAEQAHGVRARRHPPLHGRPPRAAGDPDRLRGDAQARRRRSSSPARPSACGRTSSTASSGCRCG